jgi:hypothetical protein
MKPESREPTVHELANLNRAAVFDIPEDVPTRLLERALDIMHNLYTLRVQLEDAGLKLSPACLTRIQTIADTTPYLFDVENRMPHPLRQVPEINDALSMPAGEND